VYDVGAFVGLFAMHCARTADRVICFEPMDVTRKRLLENLALNNFTNVQVRPFGVGESPATLELSFDPLMPGGASVDATLSEGIRATGAATERRTITITTLDHDAAAERLPAPDLIKIDIEGFELQALRGGANLLRTHHPELYLEMHGETMHDKRQKVRDIVVFLTELGYRNITHIESKTQITASNSDIAAEGHLYCRWQ
jgi:FkbM family methyltransferase